MTKTEKTHVYMIISAAVLFIFSGICLAKDPDVQKSNWLLGVIFKLEAMKDKAAADIQKCDFEIQKSQNTVTKSEDIIRQAKQKNNAQAEMVAGKALRTAQEAIAKNKEMKKLAELKKRRAEEALSYIKAGGKNAEAKIEQLALEDSRSEWTKKQKELIDQSLAERNPYVDTINASIITKPPPALPPRKYDELKPGDVILLSPDDRKSFWINFGDKLSSASLTPAASHTVLFLREVNGKKLFLDHTSERGSHVISEAEFRSTYGHRDAMVAQPVKEVQTADIWTKTKELVKREQERQAKNLVTATDYFRDRSGYGLYGTDNMVCSEADRWILVNSGLKLPESASPLKRMLGIHYGPANFFSDDKNFIITPMYAPAQ